MHEIMVNEGLAYGEVIKIMLSGERRQGSFTSSQMQSLSRFLEQMSSLEEKLSLLTPGALVQEVEKIFALEEFYASRTKLEDAEPGQLLFRLESLASGFEGTAAEFIRAVQLIGSHDLYDPLSDQVTLMTLHASKGLEFDVVFITGVEQELLPLLSNRFEPRNDDAVSFASDGICEEERRLFHVGITRAKSRLYLIYSRNRTLFGRKYSPKPSPFLEDIPPHVCEYKYFSQDKKSIKRIKKQKPPMLF
jgi:superfamily I DNA/RNA helicase